MAQQALVHLAVAAVAIMLLSGCTVTRTPSANLAAADDVNLVGATPATLNSTFGTPVLRRVDGTAQVWLYHSQVCGLDLILYPDRQGTLRVAMAVPDNGDPAACAASLRRDLTDAALEHATSS
ncbi:MAG TPA: hypothetical protein VNC39_13240 [Acidocella sp.]|jgi:hypothetical protein|uniref:hypothetical protein n=1 Tax=Acidocella sp. TaxID=50710 RepID=UPI002C4C3875|nr:hypothetical protein [Acidocella sp.]HVE22933.1 hypothetical protein [Acidocella sp.]